MKKYVLLLLAGLTLSACGSAPGQVSGNGRVSMGVSADDSGSTVTVTRTVTPATPETPEKITFSNTEPGLVNFTFMGRPGSDAAYITGWRITAYSISGRAIPVSGDINKLDIYVPSGYDCPERTSLPAYQSCQQYTTDLKQRPEVQPANSLPISGLRIGFASALVGEVRTTMSGASSSVDIEFYGQSSNGAPVSVKATAIQSIAYKAGD
ncbi:hypothetical protein ACI3L1_11445 [Deinococcus sp. SM5_A1]|uniref:hypothetical protein n=1 Tax=Deinococcus sp. SM5_A1 TaxID=3379094 RepID=UPI00385FED06